MANVRETKTGRECGKEEKRECEKERERTREGEKKSLQQMELASSIFVRQGVEKIDAVEYS